MNFTCKKSVLGTKKSIPVSCRIMEPLFHLEPENLKHCPYPKVPFLDDDQKFGEDLKAFGSGYAIFAHLAIFSALALVGAILITISYQHLVTILQISLAAYYCRFRWGWEEKEVSASCINFSSDNQIVHYQVGAPPLLDILLGREDEWMLKERGEAALDFLNFERMLIVISMQINVLSGFSFIVNYCAGDRSHETENHYFTPFVNRTSMSNLMEDSDWHFYHVTVSFIFPYLVLLTAHFFLPTCLTAGDNPQSRFSEKLFS